MLALAALLAAAAPWSLVIAAPPSPASPWTVPAEGACTDSGAPPPGSVLAFEERSQLRPFLPPELLVYESELFAPEMRLEIGPCHRDYSPPAFFAEATRRNRGRTRLLPTGALSEHSFGLPFAPEDIDPGDESAGLRWAWNVDHRYVGGGSRGKHRVTRIDREGRSHRYLGESFVFPLRNRADAPRTAPEDSGLSWVAGGHTRKVRERIDCDWRQWGHPDRAPEVIAFIPDLRRHRRSVEPAPEGPMTVCFGDRPEGFQLRGGQVARYRWRVSGTRDLLAAIDARSPAYPTKDDRDFGSSGVSFASDRFELRRVLVLEGAPPDPGQGAFVWYVDLQTLAPLYFAETRAGGVPGLGAQFVWRWSEDRSGYPRWPDDPERPLRVLDRVGAAFVGWEGQKVRFEAWETVSAPKSAEEERKLASREEWLRRQGRR